MQKLLCFRFFNILILYIFFLLELKEELVNSAEHLLVQKMNHQQSVEVLEEVFLLGKYRNKPLRLKVFHLSEQRTHS